MASQLFAQVAQIDGPGATTPHPTQNASPQSSDNSPEARQLLAKLREQESAAEAYAKSIIRDFKEQGTTDAKIPEDRQRSLNKMLSAVFDLKLQLEELQVKELQSRLSRFEQQIRQRKELRDKIVEHRTSQLIEKTGLEWDSPATKAKNESQVSSSPVDPEIEKLMEESSRNARVLQAVIDRHFPNSPFKCFGMNLGNVLITGDYTDDQLHQTIIKIAHLHAPDVIDHTHKVDSESKIRANGHGIVPTNDASLVPSDGKHTPTADALATKTEQTLSEVLRRHFPDVDIRIEELAKGNLLLSGDVWDGKTVTEIMDIAHNYAPVVINHINIKTRPTDFARASDVANADKQTEVSGTKAALDLRAVLRRHFPDADVKIEELANNGMLLTGEVFDTQTITQILDVAGLYAPEIVNHLRIKQRPTEASDDWKNDIGVLLEPAAMRLTAVVNRIRELELPYFRDRTGVVELQRAMEEFREARYELRNRFKNFEPIEQKLKNDVTVAELSRDGFQRRWVEAQRLVRGGNWDDEQAKQAFDQSEQAKKKAVEAKARLDEYQATMAKLIPDPGLLKDDRFPAPQDAIVTTNPSYRLDLARTLVRQQTGLELELVRCDELNLWFKTALRVCKADGKIKTGALIVLLNGHLFNSWNEAALALNCNPNNSRNNREPDKWTLLNSGLPGEIIDPKHGMFPFESEIVEPSPNSTQAAALRFEVRMHREGSDQTEVKYVSGICISPEGLFVIPVSSKMLVGGDGITVFGPAFSERAVTRIVGADDEHGLTLIKLDVPNQRFFVWVKCREKSPIVNQKIWLPAAKNAVANGAISNLGASYPLPIVANDAFAIDVSGDLDLVDGAPVFTFDSYLQGIVLGFARVANAEGFVPGKLVALPAVHLEKLLNDYLKSQETSKFHVGMNR
jgi:hypothetical protein